MFAGRFKPIRDQLRPCLGQQQGGSESGLGIVLAAVGVAALVAWASSKGAGLPRRRRSFRESVVLGRATPQIALEITRLVDKYMTMLDVSGPKPNVRLRDNLGSRWLGLATYRWSDAPAAPQSTTLIELQRRILDDQRTLERVLAHEMIHHRDYLVMDAKTKAMSRLGIRPQEHGERFLQGAAVINSEMGPGFVTIKSDQEYTTTKNIKPFYVLIEPWDKRGRLGWSWAVRLSALASQRVVRKIAAGARLVLTTEERWTSGPRIGTGSVALPRDAESVVNLQALFDSGAQAALSMPEGPEGQGEDGQTGAVSI